MFVKYFTFDDPGSNTDHIIDSSHLGKKKSPAACCAGKFAHRSHIDHSGQKDKRRWRAGNQPIGGRSLHENTFMNRH